MKNMETEFKWDANANRAFSRMLAAVRQLLPTRKISAVQCLNITDVYLDHPDKCFEKQHIAFRIRCCNQQWEVTFKARTEVKKGKAVRREETLPLPKVSNFTEAIKFLDQKKTWKNLNVQSLQPLFVIRNRSQVRTLSYEGVKAELAFDTCEIKVSGRRVFMKEIELEYKQGNISSFERLADKLTSISCLFHAHISKVKTASALLNLWGKK